LLTAGFVAGPPYRQIVMVITPKLLAAFGICRVIKHFSKRPRPSKTLEGFSALLVDPDPYSFPSAHSACAWAVAVTLGVALGAGWPIWMSYAFLISYSRIHVGAHYPLDVLIGTAIGIAIALS
ncbi:MAG: phosphatase PAP2 family protein, partial [Bdellovibrionota bacterium]